MPTIKFAYKGKTAYVDGISHDTSSAALLDEVRANFKVKDGYVLHCLYKSKKIAEERLNEDGDILIRDHPAFDETMDLTLWATVTVVGANPSKKKKKRDPNRFQDDGVWGTYEGDLDARGLRHGRGRIACEDGEVYEGDWSNDRREGAGMCRMANGAVYEGEFRRGKREGRGTYRCANGDRYEGGYKANLRSGRGTYHRSDGSRFVGEYKFGTANGPGTFYWKDGMVDVGRYRGERDVVAATGAGVRWSEDRQTAWSLQNGQILKEMGLEEAAKAAAQMGFGGVPP